MSLPRVFKTTLETIPLNVPYLFPDAVLLESWKEKLARLGKGEGLKVGIVWAGNPRFPGDRTRSLSLDRIAPLAALCDSVTFFSLQKGKPALQIQNPPAGLRLINLGDDLKDFADTAAVVCNLDLVITTDTSVAHLVGALGRPVWVMLQFVPDWRWRLDGEDSCWYPSARLFRQPRLGDWDSVIANVVEALRVRAQKSTASSRSYF